MLTEMHARVSRTLELMAAAAGVAHQDLNIRKFDPTTMKQWRTIIFVGKRGSGKSVLMKDIIGHLKQHVDFGVAMSPTEESAAFFRSILPPTSVYEGT